MAAAKKTKKTTTKAKAKVKKLSKSLLKKAKGGSLCGPRRCTTGYCQNRYCTRRGTTVAYNFSPLTNFFSPSGGSNGSSGGSSGGSRNRARAGR